MDLDVLHRMWSDLTGRYGGPETFRFFLQPAMATVFAIRDGTRDAKAGRRPYLADLVHDDPVARSQAWRQGVPAVSRVLLLGVVMDVIYQVKAFGGFKYPVETFDLAVTLAFIPCLLLRGPATRIAQWRMHRHTGAETP